MTLYQLFNTAEAMIWFFVAAVIAIKLDLTSRSQLTAVVMGCSAFVLFGVSDLLELPTAGHLPMWLWSLKIICGTLMIAARYTWLGWSKFRWRDREVIFGLSCLIAVGAVISLQFWLDRTP